MELDITMFYRKIDDILRKQLGFLKQNFINT